MSGAGFAHRNPITGARRDRIECIGPRFDRNRAVAVLTTDDTASGHAPGAGTRRCLLDTGAHGPDFDRIPARNRAQGQRMTILHLRLPFLIR
jgi:hypothetical protein